MPAGRPTKLTPEVQATICKHVAAGVSYADAARLAGVGETTLHRWRTKGKSARSGQFCTFWVHVQAALAEFRADATDVITRAGHGHSVLRPYKKRKTEVTAVVDATGRDTGNRHTKVVEEEVGADWRAIAWLRERRPTSRSVQVHSVATRGSPHIAVAFAVRTFRLPVAPTRANVDGRRLLCGPPPRRDPAHDPARNRRDRHPR